MAQTTDRLSRNALLAAVAAALGASVCCLGPFLLLLVGVSGAWIAHLAAFEHYRPYFSVLAVGLIAFSGWRILVAPRICASSSASGSACATASRRTRILFLLLAAFALLLLVSPWLLPLIYR